MAGYVRQSAADIVAGANITATPLNAEFNQLQSAFNALSGHGHTGGVGDGPLLPLTSAISGVLPIANGGTNAATAALARVSLGLEIGVNVQAFDAELLAIAGLTSAANKGITFTGIGTASTYDLSAFALTFLDDANAAAVQTTLGLVIGTNVQAFDADLSALAANATDGFWTHTGAGTGAARTLTGTAAEISITNTQGIAGNPVFSLPTALTFTGKTVTGGTYTGAAFNGTLGATTPSSIVATTGSFTGDVTATSNFIGAGNVGLATTGAGTVFLRPNGSGSGTGQTTIDSAGLMTVAGNIKPSTNGANNLGISGTAWLNGFFATGGTIDFGAGDMVITHSASTLAISGITRIGQNTTSTPGGGNNTTGATFGTGNMYISTTAGAGLNINKTVDSTLITFCSGGTTQGTISVAGATVTYAAFLGSHWSQLLDGSRPDILRGTICESIDELCSWPGEAPEDRLPRFKISDTVGSKSVYGVFAWWDQDHDEDGNPISSPTNDAFIGSLGAGWIRIAKGVTVQRGDYIESNGDGCGRVQADDIMRSSTVGKVTSTTIVETYPDGSYLVPCTLHCG